MAVDLRAAHERFLTGPTGPARLAPVRRVVLDSWLRSRRSGVDPERVSPPVDLTGPDLAAYRREHVLAPLMPIVRRLLLDGAESDGLIIALADETGRLLWVDGDRAVRRDVERVGFVAGARWGERDAGTNAPGIALATDHAVQVFGAEHFTRSVQQWSCSAAPVHDPVTGRTLGVLDVTGRDPAASPQMLRLVRATVAAMESELAVRALRSLLASSPADPAPWPTARLEVLGTSSGALVRGGQRQPLTLRHAELLLLLGARPRGTTGEELAALLHPGTLSAVTVRAEVSRLRRAVGPLLGPSRPYRLAAPLRTDVDEVRQRLARADVAGAVEAYRGPVLPRSQAPGVQALRDELAAELRTALGRSTDVGALEAWTLSPAGADDWAAWRRLVQVQAEGSPGWLRARAHVDVLDRELAGPPARAGAARTAAARIAAARTGPAGRATPAQRP
ncbi:GAF domain-containing protein [Pengzhenrongella sicca]|uniref:GAF domain-containing protein n=1 Tax=Pengzhenrongella sicca TaxID=2819238 RepID=A0A8A4ZIJ8_9MICO|nr:GAF domain-containing protein [Pengzhenrongella sicca]